MCRKDEFLIAENSQIFLKIFVISILLTFIYLVALYLLVSNQLNSSLWNIIVTLISNDYRVQVLIIRLQKYDELFHLI